MTWGEQEAGSKAALNKSSNNHSHDHGLVLGEGSRQGSRVGDRAIWSDLGGPCCLHSGAGSSLGWEGAGPAELSW